MKFTTHISVIYFIITVNIEKRYRIMRTSIIGVYQETSLHADLKRWYGQSGDLYEVFVDGYIIDIVRGQLLIEIQTGGFHKLKKKLADLLSSHPVKLIYPIAQEKWICKLYQDGQRCQSRRKSPKHGRIEDLFDELIYLPHIFTTPNFSLEVLMVQEEDILRDDGEGSWRRKGWSILDRKLLSVISCFEYSSSSSFLEFIPRELASPFTSRELAIALNIPIDLSVRMAYCLYQMGVIVRVDKIRNSYRYMRNQ
jgi:hypothetical protein